MATPTIRDRIKALRRVRAGDLIPSPKNWRTHPKVQRDALNGVLAQVGYADAILVREVDDGGLEIIDGHLRVEEADPNQEIPVLVLDVSEEEAALLLATHDPLGAMAYPDLDLYLPLIEDLNPDSEAVAALLEAVANNEARPLWEPLVPEERGLTDPDQVPAVDEKDTRVKVGQVWALGDHRLMCGDARSVQWASMRFDLLWTDPPYGIAYTGKTMDHLTFANDKPDTVLPLLVDALKNAPLKEGVPVYISAPPGRQWVTAYLAFLALGWHFHQGLVWVKDVMVLGHSDYHFRHENILYGWTPGPGRPGRGNHKGSKWHGDHSQTSVTETPRPKASPLHPTVKPTVLVASHILNSTAQGECVYDPFLGSGTTIIAAQQTGRICYTVEIEPRYCDVAIRRWEEYTGNTAVLLEAQ